MDIDAKQDRRRYVECIDCGHPYGFDSTTSKCTITSCSNYFGTKPLRPGVDIIPLEGLTGVDRQLAKALNFGPMYQMGGPPLTGRVFPDPVPPRTREIVEAERAVIAAAKVWLKSGAYSTQLAAAVAALVDLDP